MAKGKGNGIHSDPFNEVDNKDPNSPDITGEKLYYSYSEVMDKHLSETGDMTESPNSKASRDVYGGPSKGEPNPAGQKGN